MKQMISHERLLEVLSYDRASGVFLWKSLGRSKKQIAGCRFKKADGRVYLRITIDRKIYQASQLAWFYVNSEWPTRALRFANENTLDLSFENLKESEAARDLSNPETRSKYNERVREYWGANKDKRDNNALKTRFGIGMEEYTRMLVAQKGVCKICDQPETSVVNGRLKRLAVDHNHETGKLRGLLCNLCNVAIGRLRDDPFLLRKAAAYLEQYACEPCNVVRLNRS